MRALAPAVLLLLTLVAPARAQFEADRAFALRGLWYANGDTMKPCRIEFVMGNPFLGTNYLVFTNELKVKFLGTNLTQNFLVVQNPLALDGNVIGTYSPADPTTSRNQIIRWADGNNSIWTRIPNLAGKWNANGNKLTTCVVYQKPLETQAVFVNAKGERAVGIVFGNQIAVEVWGTKRVNLTGKIKRDRIEWDNNTYWSR